MLAPTLPDSERDNLLALDHARVDLDVHVDVAEVLLERPSWTGNGDESGLDLDGHLVGDLELFGGEDVAHLDGCRFE